MEWLYCCKTPDCPAGKYGGISQFYRSVRQAEEHKPGCPYCERQLTKILNGAPAVSTGWVGSAGDRSRSATSRPVAGMGKKVISLEELAASAEAD